MKIINLNNINKTLKVIDPSERQTIITNKLESISENQIIYDYMGTDNEGDILTYDQLGNYQNIDQLFGNKHWKIILIRQTESSGHWITILKYNLNGERIIENFNSYGFYPDKDLSFNSSQTNQQLGQSTKYLSSLYNQAINDGYKVIYNKVKFQQLKNGVNTCGRHVLFRLQCFEKYKMDLYKYINYMSNLKTKYKINPDNIVSLIL